MKHIVILFTTLFLIMGCATTTKLTPEQEATADYGQYPTNYEQIVKDYFSRSLFDPYSAHYRIGTPYKGYSNKAPIMGGGVDQFGYLIDVGINAKNRYGGYVGEEQYRLLIRNGQVIQQWQLTF